MPGWLSTCNEIGAPKDVDLDECLNSKKNDCETLKQGICEFDDTLLLYQQDGIVGRKACQVFTYIIPYYHIPM